MTRQAARSAARSAAKPAAQPAAAPARPAGKTSGAARKVDGMHGLMNDGLPIKNYQKLTVTQIRSHVHELTAAQRRKVRAYEASHKNRKGVLDALSGRLH